MDDVIDPPWHHISIIATRIDKVSATNLGIRCTLAFTTEGGLNGLRPKRRPLTPRRSTSFPPLPTGFYNKNILLLARLRNPIGVILTSLVLVNGRP